MTSSLPLEVRMKCLTRVLDNFFHTIGKNEEEISHLLSRMKELRREHVQFLCKDVPEKLITIREEGAITGKDTLNILQKAVATSRHDQKKSYQLIEQVIWKGFLEEIAKEGMAKKLPEITSLTSQLEAVTDERDKLFRDKESLKNALNEQQQQYDKQKKHTGDLEKKLAELTRENEKFKDGEIAKKDYREIISKIRKGLDAKKELDMWRMKVFYNRVATLTGSDWSYPGVPLPEAYTPKSKEVKKFLETL